MLYLLGWIECQEAKRERSMFDAGIGNHDAFPFIIQKSLGWASDSSEFIKTYGYTRPMPG